MIHGSHYDSIIRVSKPSCPHPLYRDVVKKNAMTTVTHGTENNPIVIDDDFPVLERKKPECDIQVIILQIKTELNIKEVQEPPLDLSMPKNREQHDEPRPDINIP